MAAKESVVCVDIDGNTNEVAIDDISFRPSVYGVIVKNGSILLTPQFTDQWDFPGGGMDLGETLDEALEREIREETGMGAKRDKLLHVDTDFFTHPGTKKSYQTVHMYFTCTDVSGEISTDGFDEHEKSYARMAEWIPIEKALTLKYCNSVDSPSLIRLAASGAGISADAVGPSSRRA